ncbi:uncharacterized protein EI97DRAFT_458365 [Westerdykella ornata]|uniref:Uncharacterized protein n=1 Tax=Westerdykella ornata TaxID=318751 RepID=A0A6A6JIG0_WESOR|nr:uncharacterized protein EI97DRAFT_458365 [Westerdykella ornata]KAF2276430.1 hypothetical protein EI97DRAFT_458365 [Westerdykella ornata]
MDSRSLLDEAIECATITRLQRTIREMCDRSDEALQVAREALLVRNEDEQKKEDVAKDLGPSSTNKRKRASGEMMKRYEICKQCKQEYDVTKNWPESCVWHRGLLFVDNEHETWVDWPDFMDMYSEETQNEYPEGFIWDCCEKRGTEPGCQKSIHRPKDAKRARREV